MFYCLVSTVPYPRTDLFFFFNDTATTEIYTLSLHDALPISAPVMIWTHAPSASASLTVSPALISPTHFSFERGATDRKSTRLNSSHLVISYAVFCLKKKKTIAGKLVTASTPRAGVTIHV